MIDCAPFVKTLNGQPIAIFGLGVSGIASVKALCEAGAKVIAWDDNADRCAEAQKQGAEIKQLSAEILKPCAHLILAPGVPLHFPQPHDVVKAARDDDTEIICDMEVLHRLNHGRKTIGITGTNGKSTTTALIHHILNSCNHPNQMGGNIGRATLDLDMPEQGGVFVLEISSYQMDLCPTFKPDIAILLNITPDHLDRHGSLEGYEAAKRRIFGGQGQVQIDLPTIDERVRICDNMKGDHNLQNATAALLACEALGLSDTEILNAIQTFPGLNHRQYTVRTHGHITYINDSKATNAEAAAKSLGAYDNIYWILGGQSKEGGLNGLEPFISNVRHAFLIGEAQDEFARWLDQYGAAYTRCDTLEKATRAAHDLAAAQSDPATILLAPACASWDQFKNFEARGDAFAKIVESL
jgi:UDP-N-acetylmuramoylalanine--D-glutamate ligase